MGCHQGSPWRSLSQLQCHWRHGMRLTVQRCQCKSDRLPIVNQFRYLQCKDILSSVDNVITTSNQLDLQSHNQIFFSKGRFLIYPLHQRCVTTKHGIQRSMSWLWCKSGRLLRWVPMSNWCVPPLQTRPVYERYNVQVTKYIYIYIL
jgi:hypothetical protein